MAGARTTGGAWANAPWRAGLAALVLLGLTRPARAEGLFEAQPKPKPPRSVYFLHFEASERSRFFGTGPKMAIRGTLDDPGWRMLATLGVKIRERVPPLGLATNRVDAGRLAFGHEFRFGATVLTPFVGASFAANSADVMQKTRRAGRVGPVGMLDLWHNWAGSEPWGSRFTAVFALADQASRSLYLRVRHGFALSDGPLRFGPELALSAGSRIAKSGIVVQEGYLKLRAGAHVSEIPLWRVRLSAGIGAEWRDDARTGFYGEIGAYLRY